MLRLRSCILPRLLSSAPAASTSPLLSLHRHLSTAAAAPPIPSQNPSFAIEDYLVATWGLTRPQARKASAELSHLKSPSGPDAVLAFLTGLGLSRADAAAVAPKDPRFLCASVDRTLSPNVAELTDFGLSHSEIARLLPVALRNFRRRHLCRNLEFLIPVFGSFDKLLQVVSWNSFLLHSDIESRIKPNLEILRECGLGACHIAKLCSNRAPWLLSANPERLRAIVPYAEGLGVHRGSAMFRHAINAVSGQGTDKIAAKVEYLKNMFRWSDAQVATAVSKLPLVLAISKDKLQRKSEFLISEVGLEPEYIAHRPAILTRSLEGQLRPRYYVLKFLGAIGLPKRDFYNAVVVSNEVFVERFIHRHKEVVPDLHEDYAAACRGEVPTRLRSA